MKTTLSAAWRARLVLAAAAPLLLAACASRSVIPEELEARVEWNLPFGHVLKNPDYYKGRLVGFGGEVLSARRLAEETRIEILQLPLESTYEPRMIRSLSQGRFLAYQKKFLDPATLPRGTRITVVGEVRGVESALLDDMAYAYPALEVRHITVWTGRRRPPRTRFHIGIGGVFVR
jgi:outer membrane lipoprotein